MHAIGKTADPFVQVVDFLVAIDQTALQIEDADDPGEVDTLAGELIRDRRSISACEYMRVLPLVR